MPAVENAIDAYLKGQWTALWEHFHIISHFQFKYFESMIPDRFRALWLDGLAGQQFKLKLCGAGGGGFLLGIRKKETPIESPILPIQQKDTMPSR